MQTGACGQQDMQAERVRQLVGENRIIGVSVQTVKQALEAERAGADYLRCRCGVYNH